MKLCWKCGDEKEESEFSFRKAGESQLDSRCKNCEAARKRAQRKQNKQDLYESLKPE